ncbi:bifunctional DNA primase/polymerase [Pseudonocardia hispaniensis]|uniref:Bifunctional DNA primase/polymerase n=1 Tax=Pseudonocardia hispaniensis TaxID=904933 RepID=A0ABW1J7D1_9PSEU
MSFQHAVAARNRGWRPFPVDSPLSPDCVGLHKTTPCDGQRGKHPAVAFTTATATEPADKQLEHWFNRGPRNIGVACGPSGLIVFDEDMLGALETFAAERGETLPSTYRVRTGRGWHWYFTTPAGLEHGNSEGALRGRHVNVRGRGGYVVAAGSVHASGHVYEAEDPHAEVAELPAWLATAIKEKPARPAEDDTTAPTRTAGRDHTGRIGWGDRHNALVSYAGRLRHKGLSLTEAETLFRVRWLDCVQPLGQIPEAHHHEQAPADCNYPVTWDEALAKLRDIYTRYQPDPLADLIDDQDDALAMVRHNLDFDGKPPQTLPGRTTPLLDDEPIPVAPFPRLDDAALHGLPGKIVAAVAPHTEAHPVPILVQLLAVLGCTIGAGAHIKVDNREHAARLYPLVLGKTSDGAKGTSFGVVRALFRAAIPARPEDGALRGPIDSLVFVDLPRQVSGLSTGEGLIELVRDPVDEDDPGGVDDKRLLVVEEEFVGTLAVGRRDGSTLPRTLRAAWDGENLQTLTRHSPLHATRPHVTVVGHATPGELRLKLDDAAMLGGTMNRFLPVASRRTKLLPEGGNLPAELLAEYGPALAEAIDRGSRAGEVEQTDDARELWRASYAHLRRSRPDGPVATILARAAPQVLRIALCYALADRSPVIDRPHIAAALAIWTYAEDTAEWLFGPHVAAADLDPLVSFIASAGEAGRTKSEITRGFYERNKPVAEIEAVLAELIKDGRIRQETEQRTGPGRRAVRYYA